MTAEPFGELDVRKHFALMASMHRQLRISRGYAGEDAFHVFGREVPDDVYERSPRPDWGKLPRISHEDESLDALERVDQRRELLLREHRGLIDDDGLREVDL